MKKHRLLWFWVRKLVTLFYKKEHFWVTGWKVNDTTSIQIISQEDTDEYHRKGIEKVKKYHEANPQGGIT